MPVWPWPPGTRTINRDSTGCGSDWLQCWNTTWRTVSRTRVFWPEFLTFCDDQLFGWGSVFSYCWDSRRQDLTSFSVLRPIFNSKFRIVIGPRRLAGDVSVVPSFADSVVTLSPRSNRPPPQEKVPRGAPKLRGAGEVYAWRGRPGGCRPPPGKGYE